MPKKMGVNSKAEEARARKASAESEKKAVDAKKKEEQFWSEAEGPKGKSAKKKEEDAERRAEAAVKRAEARKLAEQEEQELAKYGKAVDKKAGRVGLPVPKMTAAQLALQQEAERERLAAQAQASKKRESRTADTEEYERLVAVQNTNREDNIVDARDLDSALAQIATPSDLPADRHPERRLKAQFKVLALSLLQFTKSGSSLFALSSSASRNGS